MVKVKWITRRDDKVCRVRHDGTKSCYDYDNEIFDIERIDTIPPLHNNCRCRLELEK